MYRVIIQAAIAVPQLRRYFCDSYALVTHLSLTAVLLLDTATKVVA